jgi:hypothetical protein
MVFQPPRPLLLVHFILLNTSALFSKEIFFLSGIHFEVFIFHSNLIFLYFSIDSLSLLPRVKKELEKVVGLFQCRLLWIVWGPAGMIPPLST